MSQGSQPPVLVQPLFLPVPQVPSSRHLSAVSVANVVGAELAGPLLTLEQVHAAAEDAVRVLEECRPGPLGRAWRKALEDDVRAYGSEESPPKRLKAQVLLEGDAGRWAHARAACGYVKVAQATCERQLERTRVAATAATVASAKAKLWRESAEAGWLSRLDRAVAYQHFRRAQEHLAGYVAAGAVAAWARQERLPDRDTTPPAYDFLPADPAGRGWWLCLSLSLEHQTWLRLPKGVQWPEGGEELALKAMPESGSRYAGLTTRGYAEIDR